MSKTSIELDIPTDAAERVRQQDEYILKQAHRDLLPVVVMQKIALAIVARMEAEPAPLMNREMQLPSVTPARLYQIIMQEFDKELG